MDKTPKERIHDLASAYLLSSAIHAAAELGIADILFEHSEMSVYEIAKHLRADVKFLFRLMRFLVSHQIFVHNQNHTFSLNSESAYLAEAHPESIRHALLVNKGPRWNAIGAISEAVVTGRPAFDVLYGKTYYEYLDDHPESFERFNAHMTAYTQEEDKLLAPFLPIEKAKILADIGGGEGQFLNEILKHFQNLHGILFDLKADAKKIDDNSRCETVRGSFFDSVPSGADIYVLKRVLHNWESESCIQILQNIRKAMKEDSRIFVIEGMIPEDSSRHLSKDTDLFLMTLFSGCERTFNEFKELSEQAELRIANVFPTSTFLSIIELKNL